MEKFWWLEIVGYIMIISGAWRVIWRLPVILGLVGANKLGTAKGAQQDVNTANINEVKKGLPIALALLVIGIVLVLVF